MKALKNILLTAFLINLSLLATKEAPARCRIGVFIGTGYCYPGHYYDDFYFHHYGWPHYQWGADYYPGFVIERPVVIQRKTIVVQKPVVLVQENKITAKTDEETLKLFASIRNKKDNLLEQLGVSDRQERIKAIEELAGYSYDDKVIEKLKDILLKDPDVELRKEAAKAFGEGRNRAVVSILEQAKTSDSDESVRREAESAIAAIKKT